MMGWQQSVGVVVALVFFIWGEMTLVVNAKNGRRIEMAELIQAAREAILQYEETKDLAYLEEAVEKLNGVDLFEVQGGTKRAEVRLQTLMTWMLVLARIDAAKDPNFDPEDAPLTKVSPPQVPGEPAYPPGVDPKVIRNPEIRAEYERVIEQNRQKALRSQYQWELKALDTEVTESVMSFVKRFYTSSPADQKELSTTMEEAGVTTERRRQLETLKEQ
jgi:hypothetical protein